MNDPSGTHFSCNCDRCEQIQPEPPFKIYRVTWQIDLDATSPEVAAEKALEIMRDATSWATIFEVQEHGAGGAPVTVDLAPPSCTDAEGKVCGDCDECNQ